MNRQTTNLSIQALNDRVKNYSSLLRIFEKLFDRHLTANQRLFVQEKLSNFWFDLGLVHYDMENYKQAKRCFLKSLNANPSFKNIFKFILGFSGPLGINLIEQKRKATKGFRRSEFYQNGQKK